MIYRFISVLIFIFVIITIYYLVLCHLDDGAMGEKGDIGDIGDIGPPGRQGVKGINGERGPIGIRGEPNLNSKNGSDERILPDILGVDILLYQEIEDLVEAVTRKGDHHIENPCMACLNGDYVV